MRVERYTLLDHGGCDAGQGVDSVARELWTNRCCSGELGTGIVLWVKERRLSS